MPGTRRPGSDTVRPASGSRTSAPPYTASRRWPKMAGKVTEYRHWTKQKEASESVSFWIFFFRVSRDFVPKFFWSKCAKICYLGDFLGEFSMCWCFLRPGFQSGCAWNHSAYGILSPSKNSFGSGAAGWGAGWWAEQGGVPVDPGFLQQAPGPEGQGEEDVQGNTAPALSLDVQILYSCWTGFKIRIQDTVNKNSELLTILSDNAGKSKNMIFKI